MTASSPGNITELLLDWRNGNKEAFNKLVPVVYDRLRQIARQKHQQYGLGGMLHPTAVVHEAYLELIDETKVEWRSRAHFYAIAANTIRRILIEDYRKRTADKRGGDKAVRVSFSEAEALTNLRPTDFTALNEALERLEALDERQAKIVELRFFGGLNNDEIAEALEISRTTVEREWRSAKAWLFTELSN